MQFTFSEEQDALRQSVRSFLDDRAAEGHVRAMLEDRAGFSETVWTRMVDLGWPGLLIPETHGGLGLGMVDLSVVLEEMGRLPFPGPFFSSSVLATRAATLLGSDDRLRQLASGETRGTVALDELGHGDPVDRITTRAVRRHGRWLLTGLKPTVIDGETADWILVVARTPQGLGTFELTEHDAETVPAWDKTRRLARLALDGTPAVPVGPDGDQTELWRRIADDARVALCSELIGSAERTLELAVEYAKVREQFGRPIARFQVIKHKTVDMLHRVELARVGTHYAAWASDTDDPIRAEAAAMAASYVPEAANFVAAEAIQIHGAVGFTWECDAHLHYRRAKQNDLMLGYSGLHRQRVADLALARI